MPLFYADRVKQQIIASGNGFLTLSTPIASYIQFSNANIAANSFPYVIANSLQFEVGIGTFGTPGATGTTYGVIYRNTILSVSNGDASPVNFNGSAAIVSISNASELSVLVSSQPSPGTNKIIKWAGYEYELFDPIENGPSLGTSINNSVMYYNSATTNYDADANLKFFSGATPELFINGVIQATAKAFKIPHPIKAGKWLMHGCLEGPEYGIYLRGTEYFRFKKEIIFPEYFTKIAETFNYSVIISSNCFTPIKVIKYNHKVIIKSLFPTIKNIEIDYMIIAERNDVEFNLEV
jgi:hypothetical protein